jgi:hypothetical protein
MARLGPNVAAFVKHQMETRGITLLQALRLPEAMDADLADQVAKAKHDKGRSKTDWIKNVQPDADGKVRFQNADEFHAAIADPLYKTSEQYRQAVAQMADNTDASVLGVSGHVTSADGTTVKVGRDGLHEATTVETMEREAYRDMIREKMGKIDRSTATGRWEYLQFLKDANNQAVIAEIEAMVVSPEQRTRQELMDAKASGGENLRIQLGQDGTPAHPKDINWTTGKYMDGSEPPSNSEGESSNY